MTSMTVKCTTLWLGKPCRAFGCFFLLCYWLIIALNYVIGITSWQTCLIWFNHIQELGVSVAFSCAELDLIIFEVERVDSWKQQCMDIVKSLIGDEDSLLGALEKVWN